MSINSDYQPNIYISNGSNKNFTITFPFLQREDIKVLVYAPKTQKQSDLIYGTDYNIDNKISYNNGGILTLNNTQPKDTTIVIFREIKIDQQIDLLSLQSINPRNLTFIFDKITAIEQELRNSLKRQLTFTFQQLSMIDHSKVVSEDNIKLDPEYNPRNELALMIKYNPTTKKWEPTTSKRSPDQIDQGTETLLGTYKIATTSEALQGSNDNKVMTPLKTKQVVDVEAASRVQGDAIVAQNANTRMDNLVS
ncbi:MAG: hypothetical protein LBH46_04345, partial [Rickettsiales bacterium]|nr:hypothetical protein [Rickettsiales bacterium]